MKKNTKRILLAIGGFVIGYYILKQFNTGVDSPIAERGNKDYIENTDIFTWKS